MSRTVFGAPCGAITALFLALSACASNVPSASLMPDGALTAPPAGWLDYCERNANDPGCRPVELSQERWEQLGRVQRQVYALGAREDRELYRRSDFWTAAGPKGGDCEDHALAARQRLLALGWPPSALRLAMAWNENGDYHAVLTVDMYRRGQRVTYVLDSRWDQVRSWDELTDMGYRWDRRQARGQPFWVTIAAR